MTSGTETSAPVLQKIIGQDGARSLLTASLAMPVNAYFFLGPAGTGKLDAAMAFSAALVCPNGGCGQCASCLEALAGRHPDVLVVERQGAATSVDEVAVALARAQRSPRAGDRQVIVLPEFNLALRAAPALLKTLEEPPLSTVFVVLGESVPRELETVASRCLTVDFVALDVQHLAGLLVSEGIEESVAYAAAAGSGGRLDRARLLAVDSGFSDRQERWRRLPELLDGTGSTVARLSDELLASAEELVAVLRLRQESEMAELEIAATRAGERRVAGRQLIETRHRREQRRVRTDELRAGLATLASAYRTRLESPGTPARRVAGLLRAASAIDACAAELVRNPNLALLVQALLVELDASGAI